MSNFYNFKGTFFVLIFAIFLDNANSFQDTPFTPNPDIPSDWIDFRFGASFNILDLREEIDLLNENNECIACENGRLKLLKINLNDPNATPRIGSPDNGDGKYIIEKEGDDWFIFLIESFDADIPNPTTLLRIHPGPGTTSKVININFIDINDNVPYFELLNSQIYIDENCLTQDCIRDNVRLIPNTSIKNALTVVTLKGDDQDKLDEGLLTFTVTGDFEGSYYAFQFEKVDTEIDTYELILSNPDPEDEQIGLDFERRASHRLNIIIKDSANSDEHSFSLTLLIMVYDQPDRPPIWSNFMPSITIKEDVANPLITTIAAIDGDINVQASIAYTLKTDDSGLFDLDGETGELQLVGELDAEKLDNLIIRLVIEAAEKNDPSRPDPIGDTTINNTMIIVIEDINDNRACLVPLNETEEICENIFLEFETYETKCDSSVAPSCNEKTVLYEFDVLDEDVSLDFSSYFIELETDEERIWDGLEVLPATGSGLTKFFLSVKNSDEIDFDGEDPFWREEKNFIIRIVENNAADEIIMQEINVKLSVLNLNDHIPKFQGLPDNGEYLLKFREDISNGEVFIDVKATDGDFGDEYSTIRYRWGSTRTPPLSLNTETGDLTVNSTGERAFDFEQIPQHYVVIEAEDNGGENGNINIVVLQIELKDVNDEKPMLFLPEYSIEVDENIDSGSPIFPEFNRLIRATDRDTDPFLNFSMEIIENIIDPEGCKLSNIQNWFKLELEDYMDPDDENAKFATIIIGTESPDRECTDRVTLIITVKDENADDNFPDQSISQTLIVSINDLNDEQPEFFPRIDTLEVLEYNYNETDDPVPPFQREIVRFYATDKDRLSTLTYEIEFEVGFEDWNNTLELIGNILYRREYENIDREKESPDGNETTEYVKFVIYVFDDDRKHNDNLTITMKIFDINDNEPIWKDCDPSVIVFENFTIGEEIMSCNATDKDSPDKFGKISYVLEGQDNNFFEISENGEMTLVNKLTWSDDKETYRVNALAMDDHRSGIVGLHTAIVQWTIIVEDVNDQIPEFYEYPDGFILGEIEESKNDLVDYFVTFKIHDMDDPRTNNSQINVNLERIERTNDDGRDIIPDGFFDSTYEQDGRIVTVTITTPIDTFINRYGNYDLYFYAEDKGSPPLNNKAKYSIIVKDENNNKPIFTSPTNEMGFASKIKYNYPNEDPLASPDGREVPLFIADDLDDPDIGNGKVTLYLNQSQNTENLFYFGLAFDETNPKNYYLYKRQNMLPGLVGTTFDISIIAADEPNGLEPLTTEIIYSILIVGDGNFDPIFIPNDLSISFLENTTNQEPKPLRQATDFDMIDDEIEEIVYYNIAQTSPLSKEEFENYFELSYFGHDERHQIPLLSPKPNIDREEFERHELILYATNLPGATIPPIDRENRAFLFVEINIDDIPDTAPEFRGLVSGEISGGFIPSEASFDSQVKIIEAYDRDVDKRIIFELSGPFNFSDPSLIPPNNTAPFDIISRPPTNEDIYQTALIIKFNPTNFMKGHFEFYLTASDNDGFSTTVLCKIYVINNGNIVDFTFIANFQNINERRSDIAVVLSEVFKEFNPFIESCSVDNIMPSPEEAAEVIVRTHFIDRFNLPMPANSIINMQFQSQEFLSKLRERLNEENFSLSKFGFESDGDNEDSNLIVFLLVGGVAFLLTVLVVISIIYWFRNKSLTRKVRALAATSFGSHDSGLNKMGSNFIGSTALPGTNVHAHEGSNPIWTIEGDGKKVPAFDEESVGSGGSILIGAEDDDHFESSKNQFRSPSIVSSSDEEGDFGSAPPLYDDLQDFSDLPFENKSRVNPLAQLHQNNDVGDFY